MLKKLLTLATVLAVISGIVWGILYLEAMREHSAEESRRNEAAALEAARQLERDK